jgi:hypothetical protein
MTTVLSPIHFDHLVQVVHHEACGHRAECWCGWASAWGNDYDAADASARDHREVVSGPASDLDATLSELLDLQDDIADTLIWLAENWSSDLPVPRAHPRVRYLANGECVPCLRLLICCPGPDELAAMAVLLACPVVADAEPNQYGSRYQRVTRSFGRVDIDAYRAIDGRVP